MAHLDDALMADLDRLARGTWAVLFKDSTSPKPDFVVLSEEVLDRGIGEVGSINIPPFIWHAVVPEQFSTIASRRLQEIDRSLGRASVWRGLQCGTGSCDHTTPLCPRIGGCSPSPKNREKASMIVHFGEFK